MGSACSIGTVRLSSPTGSGDMPNGPTAHLDDSTGHGLRSALARKSFLSQGLLGGLLPPGLGVARA
jgi:hypothetical protein